MFYVDFPLLGNVEITSDMVKQEEPPFNIELKYRISILNYFGGAIANSSFKLVHTGQEFRRSGKMKVVSTDAGRFVFQARKLLKVFNHEFIFKDMISTGHYSEIERRVFYLILHKLKGEYIANKRYMEAIQYPYYSKRVDGNWNLRAVAPETYGQLRASVQMPQSIINVNGGEFNGNNNPEDIGKKLGRVMERELRKQATKGINSLPHRIFGGITGKRRK